MTMRVPKNDRIEKKRKCNLNGETLFETVRKLSEQLFPNDSHRKNIIILHLFESSKPKCNF